MIPESKPGPRAPHADHDPAARRRKADLMVELIEQHRPITGSVLEVGCGSAHIAARIAERTGAAVTGVDVLVPDAVPQGVTFVQVSDTQLPFSDGSFDLTISNFVIEHVGDAEDRRHHLAEIRRVTKHDGLVYLGIPNRRQLVEPHYGLPLLSWVSQEVADRMLRATGRGDWFDVNAPTRSQIEDAMRAADLEWCDVSSEAAALRLGGIPGAPVFFRSPAGAGFMRAVRQVVPSWIFLASHDGRIIR